MSINVRILRELEAKVTPEDRAEAEAKSHEELEREIARLNDTIAELAKTGRGIQWDGERWAIVDIPGLNTQFERGETISLSTKTRLPGLPPIPTSQKTMLPSSNGMRALTQSFGPGLRHKAWDEGHINEEGVQEMQMVTPNESLLRVYGKNEPEHQALQHYIVEEIGVEGLKHLVVLLNAYYTQTDARERKDDARVNLRQLLIQMGYGNRADDKDEQRKLMRSILYLSRTWIMSTETRQDTGKRGRKSRYSVEYSPLIVLETMKAGEGGSLQLPEYIEFHLGKEFYDLLFGERKHFFSIPTAPVLIYHAVREQQELCLAFYLSNFINMNYGKFEVDFVTMLAGSGIRLEEDIEKSDHRTRDALRVLYGMERIQKDRWVIRGAHPDIDLVLAIELLTDDARTVDDLAEETYTRIMQTYSYLDDLPHTDLYRKRREALQRLLKGESPPLRFKAGALLKEQAEKREEQRQKAIERNERAQVARVTKAATGQVVKNLAAREKSK